MHTVFVLMLCKIHLMQEVGNFITYVSVSSDNVHHKITRKLKLACIALEQDGNY